MHPLVWWSPRFVLLCLAIVVWHCGGVWLPIALLLMSAAGWGCPPLPPVHPPRPPKP